MKNNTMFMLYENDRQTARKENSIVLAAHDNLSTAHLLHTELHWLDVPERVLYKLALMVHRPPISPRQGAAVSVELLCASL